MVEPPRHSPSHLLAHTCSVDAGWPRERGLPGSAHRTIAAAGGGRSWAAPAAMPARQPCQVSRKHAPRTADGPPHGAVGSESSPKPGSLLCCAPLAGLLLCSSPTCPGTFHAPARVWSPHPALQTCSPQPSCARPSAWLRPRPPRWAGARAASLGPPWHEAISRCRHLVQTQSCLACILPMLHSMCMRCVPWWGSPAPDGVLQQFGWLR